MHIFEVGQRVDYLQFLPDGERLLIRSQISPSETEFAIRHPFTGDKVVFELPQNFLIPSVLHRFNIGADAVAIPGSGDVCYIAWDDQRLYAFDTHDGSRLNEPDCRDATRVIVSADGGWLVSIREINDPNTDHMRGIIITPSGGPVLWKVESGSTTRPNLAGFLSHREFIYSTLAGIYIRRIHDGSLVRTKETSSMVSSCQLSPDRQFLGVHYVEPWRYEILDIESLTSQGQIPAGASKINFVSECAFGPRGNKLGVTRYQSPIVEEFDFQTLEPTNRLDWHISNLTTIDYSPNGTLAAAGSEDGRVVIWDVEN